jgi:Fe-Mn family superoxide dismutase
MNSSAALSHPIVQPPLPYEQNALNPVISSNTLAVHYGKHHKTHVDTANKLIVGTEFADMSLEQIVHSSDGKAEHAAILRSIGNVCGPRAAVSRRRS